jgi:hydrogenase-1 operon protein HyaF
MREGREHIEIGAIPDAVLMAPQVRLSDLPQPGAGVVNAPAIITEILDHVENPQGDSHVINLTLLPHTPQDLDYLDLVLGRGGVTILSRGYGNCRIDRCAHPHVWRVRYYNSQDILILDTIEITDIPDVACAAAEDIRDTASRLKNVSEALT